MNASSVETDLGGGNYSYPGLILTDKKYASISHTQLFILPHYPPLLVIPSTATPIEALELKDNKRKRKEYT